jgi:predicted nucleotidyltransferase
MTSAEARARVVDRAREVVAEDLPDDVPLRVVLFGSRVRGDFDERSDFDIGIDAGAPLAASVLLRIREAFDALDILQRVDVVDLAAARPEFRALAAQHEEVIFER